MAEADRKKRADLKTVPKMKPSKGSPTRPPAESAASAAERSGTRGKRVAGRRGGLTEELAERARRDPRREQD